jgi:putative membrane protein
MLVALLGAIPLAAWAAGNAEEWFYRKAAEAGMAEVQTGEMAQDKATSPALKAFAAMMVRDHTEANEKLQRIAAARDIDLPRSPGLINMAREKKAEMKSGASFDEDYIQQQVRAHQDAVALLQREIDSGKDPDALAFARERLPKVKAHLARIHQIAASAGVQ